MFSFLPEKMTKISNLTIIFIVLSDSWRIQNGGWSYRKVLAMLLRPLPIKILHIKGLQTVRRQELMLQKSFEYIVYLLSHYRFL